jgi:hypothetical protein
LSLIDMKITRLGEKGNDLHVLALKTLFRKPLLLPNHLGGRVCFQAKSPAAELGHGVFARASAI